VRTATAVLPVPDGDTKLSSLSLDAFTGIGLDGDVQGSDPTVELEVALDGISFSDPMRRSAGGPGEYRKRMVFGPLGTARPGYVLFRATYSDPVGIALLGATLNVESRR
jgi:hypothetical protein